MNVARMHYYSKIKRTFEPYNALHDKFYLTINNVILRDKINKNFPIINKYFHFLELYIIYKHILLLISYRDNST